MIRKSKHKTDFAIRLDSFMRDHGLTQQQVANAAGVRQSAVSQWLSGSMPGAAELHKFAKANGVSVDLFLDGGDGKCKNYIDISGMSVKVGAVSQPIPTWSELKKEIIRFTARRGAKSALAKEIGVSRQTLGNWLSGKAKSSPSADLTLELFRRVRN